MENSEIWRQYCNSSTDKSSTSVHLRQQIIKVEKIMGWNKYFSEDQGNENKERGKNV